MSQVEIDGQRWNFLDVGTGPPLLFVHGFPLDGTMWRHQWSAFSGRYRCIVPDLCGFGESQPCHGTLSMTCLADNLAALLDHLQITSRVAYCGLSMGGYVGWQMWQRHRSRLRCLVQCDTRAVADTPEVARGRELMAQSIHQDGAASVAEAMIPKLFSPHTLESQPELVAEIRQVIAATDTGTIAAAQLGMAVRSDFSSALAEIELPTLFVCGEDDEISLPEEMRGLAQRVPESTFVEIPAAGHLAPLEQPAAFNRALEEFLGCHHVGSHSP